MAAIILAREASLTVADLAEVGQRHHVRTVPIGPCPSPLIKELKGYFYSNLGGTLHCTGGRRSDLGRPDPDQRSGGYGGEVWQSTTWCRCFPGR